MTDELKNKLTERFEFLAKHSEEQVSADIYDALLKAYLAGGEYGHLYAVDKACKWLSKIDVNDYLKIVPGFGYVIDEDAIKDFRKAMED